jgi:hypothetical protein
MPQDPAKPHQNRPACFQKEQGTCDVNPISVLCNVLREYFLPLRTESVFLPPVERLETEGRTQIACV